MAQWILLILLIICYITEAQIPRVCSDSVSLANKACCPIPQDLGNNAGACGTNLKRGTCTSLSSKCHSYTRNTDNTDPRFNWPFYFFTTACNCSDNYAGIDCGECKFGYTGINCSQKTELRERKSINSDNVNWTSYINILKRAKKTNSRYVILHFDENIFRGHNEPVTNYRKQNVTVYNLFAWMHHYIAKTNDESYVPQGSANDYAHESAGFLTWHRLFLLWFEREVQVTLNEPDFTLYFWNWTIPDNRESIFKNEWLGQINNGSVTGNFAGSEWKTVCWFKNNKALGRQTCDITNSEGIHSLIRCPDMDSCKQNSSKWPTSNDTNTMMTYSMYRDSSEQYAFNKFARQSFSNYLEGFVPENDIEKCDDEEYPNTDCKPNDADIAITRKLHNLVHITLGIGYIKNKKIGKSQEAGTMADVAASANDPVFINHHTMIDCLFEQWLNNQTNPQYVGPVNEPRYAGHGIDDCLVPFLPLYTHRDMFKRAKEFGYKCSSAAMIQGGGLLLVLFLVMSMTLILG